MKTTDQTTTTHLYLNMGAHFSTMQSESCSLLAFQTWGTNSGALRWGHRLLKGLGAVYEHPKVGRALRLEAVGLWTAAIKVGLEKGSLFGARPFGEGTQPVYHC